MSSFARFPSVIIGQILKQATLNKELSAYRDTIRFLHICSHWRKVAINDYYSVVYYKSINDDNSVNANADLVLSTGFTKYVKHIIIDLYTIEQLVRFLNRYQTLFRAEITDWTNIKEFDIAYSNLLPIPMQTELDGQTVNVHDKFIEFASYITTHMPNVSKLMLYYMDVSDTTNVATEIFLNAYSKKLLNFQGYFTSCFHNDYLFDNLTGLELVLNPEAQQMLPRINYSKMVWLVLNEIPYAFKWTDMFSDTSLCEVNFHSLNDLTLRFLNNHTDGETEDFVLSQQITGANHNFKITFSELKFLGINNQPSWFISEKTEYCFVKPIKHFTMLNPFKTQMIKNISVKQLNSCDLYFSDQSNYDCQNFYKLTNMFFGEDNNYQHTRSKLQIYLNDYSIAWDKTKWSNLKKILLRKCNVSTFISTQQHCPRLISISVDEFDIDMPLSKFDRLLASADASSSKEGTSRMCPLEYLGIKEFTYLAEDTQEAASFIKVYLKHCKSLIYLNIHNGQWMNIKMFAESLERYYPHLANIALYFDYCESY